MKNTPQQLQTQTLHIPVLLLAVLDMLKPKKGDRYLDLTAGYGGHARAVLSKVGSAENAVLVDRDKNTLEHLEGLKDGGATLINSDYASTVKNLVDKGEKFDMILLDLGVSSPQLDNAERGFSIKRDGPLDMRMDQTSGITAAEIVNRYPEKELAKILKVYGEEPKASKIAHAIVLNRPLKTTSELASVIKQNHRGKWSKIDPATRTFQALRIAVNEELKQLEDALPLALQLLNPDGRIAVISFHSLEDGIVKRFFKEQAEAGYEATLRLINPRPISGATDDVNNPRARSAKLRAAVKIKK